MVASALGQYGSLGLLLLSVSNALLILNFKVGFTLVFLSGVVLAATGHGMTLLAGINMVNRIAQTGSHARLMSTFLVIGYIGTIIPMLGIGWVADHLGLPTAVSMFCGAVIVLAMPVSLGFYKHPRMRVALA